MHPTKTLTLALALFALGLLAADAPPATAPASQPATLVVWDGEAHNVGSGWVDHKDVESIKLQDTEAHSGKNAVAFTGQGDKWHGCGWNWTLWNAAKATDSTPYTHLSFWVKVSGTAKPTELKLSLTSTDGKMSPQLDALKYEPKVFDGQWHEVLIPLPDIFRDPSETDPKKLWEIELGNWNTAAVDFTLYLDDVAFVTKFPAATAPTTAPQTGG